MAAPKGQKKVAGRKKGVPNKATADIKAAFQLHGDELVEALLKLTKDEDARVRLGAINACLDRGWGKPAQFQEIVGKVEHEVTDLSNTEISRLILAGLKEAEET